VDQVVLYHETIHRRVFVSVFNFHNCREQEGKSCLGINLATHVQRSKPVLQVLFLDSNDFFQSRVKFDCWTWMMGERQNVSSKIWNFKKDLYTQKSEYRNMTREISCI
jgi:hypothetical protein